jgi:hypothetical protein
MLIFNDTKYIKTPFKNEDELEQVVISNYEYIFGPTSIYLPKKLIKTGDGAGTIPDGFVIDLGSKKWYLVEAELLHHHVWNHIAPQVSKQVIASLQPISKKIVEDLAVDQYQKDPLTKEKFTDQGIKEINVRKVLSEILEKDPSIGIPIDAISGDLKEWARTLKYNVKLWTITKYVEFNKPENVVYEFPEEFKPELDTSEEEKVDAVTGEVTRYDASISDLIDAGFLKVGDVLIMEYKPRNGKKKRYEGIIESDGAISVLGQSYSSPSYAALAGIQDAGSDRKTVNGWISWRDRNGQLLTDLREEYLNLQREKSKA